MNVLKYLTDRVSGKAEKGQRRSSKWSKIRKKHLKDNPKCALCGSKKKIEVHHILPFSIAPDLELELENLITLCENKKYGVCCHLFIGHLGNYRKFNPQVKIDAMAWGMKIRA